MTYQYNDGGREAAGYKGITGDCVCRAIAIAAQRPYKEVYDLINEYAKKERDSKRNKRSNARTGVRKETAHKILVEHYGFTWVPTMQIGSGCTKHLRAEELPAGRLVCACSGHYTAVIDGVLNDTYDCTRDGTRCVYGYYINTEAARRDAERKQKADFVRKYLAPLLRASGVCIKDAVYKYDATTGEEIVTITYNNGYTKDKCVTADSLIALCRDTMRYE